MAWVEGGGRWCEEGGRDRYFQQFGMARITKESALCMVS
jgi:hypothetical protein